MTDDYKKAALSAISIMVIRPFEPIDPDNVDNLESYLANPIFALACANVWASQRNLFLHYPHDYLKRFYSSLLITQIESLDPFLNFIKKSEDHEHLVSIKLSSREIALIDSWVLKIHMLVNQKR